MLEIYKDSELLKSETYRTCTIYRLSSEITDNIFLDDIGANYIELKRHTFSLNIPNHLLNNLNTPLEEIIENFNRRLINDSIEADTNKIVKLASVFKEDCHRTDSVLFLVTIYASDLDIINSTIARMQNTIIHDGYSESRSIFDYKPDTWTDEAEERAHQLLKEIVSKKDFETYRDEGYLDVKGTYGREYRIKKQDMIQVDRYRKGKHAETYRLCLEPKDYGTICPTDETILKYKMIKASEKLLHEKSERWR